MILIVAFRLIPNQTKQKRDAVLTLILLSLFLFFNTISDGNVDSDDVKAEVDGLWWMDDDDDKMVVEVVAERNNLDDKMVVEVVAERNNLDDKMVVVDEDGGIDDSSDVNDNDGDNNRRKRFQKVEVVVGHLYDVVVVNGPPLDQCTLPQHLLVEYNLEVVEEMVEEHYLMMMT